jgi:hypothetical protein
MCSRIGCILCCAMECSRNVNWVMLENNVAHIYIHSNLLSIYLSITEKAVLQSLTLSVEIAAFPFYSVKF